MSAMSENNGKYKPIFDAAKFDDLNKKYYGLGAKDLQEINVFIEEFASAMNDIKIDSDYDVLKELVKTGNKIPSHCGYMVCAYYVNNYGDDAFNQVLFAVAKGYKEQAAQDPESTKTTDLYEVLSCLIQFAPAKTMRKFIQDHIDVAKEMYVITRKRPGTSATMSARFAELFVTSRFNEKYSNMIYDNFQAMLTFLQQKNGEIDGINDAVRINFNQLRDIMKDFYERDKNNCIIKNF